MKLELIEHNGKRNGTYPNCPGSMPGIPVLIASGRAVIEDMQFMLMSRES